MSGKVDLLALIGADVPLKRVATTSGGEYAGPCPFCGGEDRFRVWPEEGRYWCRGCDEKGDAPGYLMRRDGLSYPEALRRLGIEPERRNGQGGEGGSIPPRNRATAQPCNRSGCTVTRYADTKRLPPDFLRKLGLSDMIYQGAPAVRIPYLDEQGTEVAVQFRLALDKTEGTRFRWRRGDRPVPYGLWRLEDARKVGRVTLVEGASDCHTLWLHNEPALGLPGADGWREDRDAPVLDGIPTVYLVIEPDSGGEAVKRWLSKSHIRNRVRLVELGEHKDPSGLYLADPDRFAENWQAALDRAVPFIEIEQSQAKQVADKAWVACRDLALRPGILDEFASDLARVGVAGEERTAKLLYLALVSRYLERPVSVAVKGPSSGGKSFLVEKVLTFSPAESYFALSAMSERALAYSDEPLSHRYLVIYEAAGLNSDFASYLLRSLLSEGRVRYETVEKTADGLKPRLIEREGPTGLIVTTTAVHLHPENETRMLSLTVNDTPRQTREVLLALADGSSGEVDVTRWHALQHWLDGAEHRVTIPYARQLAELIPPVAVRLRRDFGAILALIRAHAILHQATRERDAEGRIVATVADYAAVRDLVADVISEGVEATVPQTVRETVQAVACLVKENSGDPVSLVAVARKLELDKATALRRVRAAVNHGYVKNLEDRKGRPARLVLGDAMPDEVELLPDPERLHGCTVARLQEGIDTPSPPPLVEARI